jgi:hypothetical protein
MVDERAQIPNSCALLWTCGFLERPEPRLPMKQRLTAIGVNTNNKIVWGGIATLVCFL